ncbi:MAG: hypothetical protein ACLTCI_02035 [[Clostridium] nexile]
METQAIAISAKALMNDTVVEEPLEKKNRDVRSRLPFDTAYRAGTRSGSAK